MSNLNLSPSSYEDETSDTLSTANSYTYLPTDANIYRQLSEIPEPDVISPQNRPIRKKRSAYGKIDDDKRLKLLEAVQNGETLKSASKRLGINYSSAKSIIHTYRKEGRILKKSICPFPYAPIQLSLFENVLPGENAQVQTAGTFVPFEFHPSSGNARNFSNEGPSSPINGLTGALGQLLLENPISLQEPVSLSATQSSSFESVPQNQLNGVHMQQQAESQSPRIPIVSSEHVPAHPWELLKNLDNFYMNYSNSPLSGGKGNMCYDFVDSNSHKRNPREFESFSELINSFQNPNRNEDQTHKGSRSNPIQDSKLMEDSFGFSSNMTRENYKNLLESQFLLADSLQKVSFLNGLSRFQNLTVSPINGWNK